MSWVEVVDDGVWSETIGGRAMTKFINRERD